MHVVRKVEIERKKLTDIQRREDERRRILRAEMIRSESRNEDVIDEAKQDSQVYEEQVTVSKARGSFCYTHRTHTSFP